MSSETIDSGNEMHDISPLEAFLRESGNRKNGKNEESIDIEEKSSLKLDDLLSENDKKDDSSLINKTVVERDEFSFDLYLALYPDLIANGVNTFELAKKHYNEFGKSEGRIASFNNWANSIGIDISLILPYLFENEKLVKEVNSIDNPIKGIVDIISRTSDYPVKVSKDIRSTSRFYADLAKHFITQGDKESALKFFTISLHFYPCLDVLEHVGNIHLDHENFRIAGKYYEKAIKKGADGAWIYTNYLKCLQETKKFDLALKVSSDAMVLHADFPHLINLVDQIVNQYWDMFHSKQFAYVDIADRKVLIENAVEVSDKIYSVYEKRYLSYAKKQIDLRYVNLEKVLIVGDCHIKQCQRYRIDQKVEQLKLQGIEAEVIDWTKLNSSDVHSCLYDLVIFYRVPAVPEVIKKIAEVNAVGRLSVYEIDDLIFDEIYPPKLDSYGGYVGINTYRELTRGMALFNAAARLCYAGIASTKPLCDELIKLVKSKQCIIHRNGLDKLNVFSDGLERENKKTIDIFYGSGTQAHNSDFIELALPAIKKILTKHENARLVVVGYLKLPSDFLSEFSKQFLKLDPVKSEKGYYSLLSNADINIAVLEEDKINDSKSELKWFEAACFSIPSVLSATQNYKDVIINEDIAFLAENTSEWFKKLDLLVSNKNLRKSMGALAKAHIENLYTPDYLGSQLVESITKISPLKPNKKKVALVNVFFPPQSIGGATRVVEDNFNVLKRDYAEDIELCVFTANSEFQKPHQIMSYNHKGTRVYRATTLWRENMDWHPKDEKMYDLFTEFLKLEKPDIIHFHCVQRLTASIVEAAKDSGIPYIVTAHDAWWISDFQFLVDHNDKVYLEGHPDPYETIELPPNITREQSIERKQYLKSLLLGAASVLTVSESFADIYRKNGISNIKAIPNGISDEIQWLPKDTSYSEKVVCAHIGGMSEHKGYHLFKEAIEQLQPENIEALVVDHSKDEGFSKVEYWGDIKVTFIGRVKQNNIVALYQRIDVLFAPSIWPESFGLVTREAAACGCWIVASNIGGIGEDVAESVDGFIVSPTLICIKNVIEKINSILYKTTTKSGTINFVKSQVDMLVSMYND